MVLSQDQTALARQFDLGHQGKSMLDRKSTRLNSSHGYISYAVFCLKKKKQYAGLLVAVESHATVSGHPHLLQDVHRYAQGGLLQCARMGLLTWPLAARAPRVALYGV